ncbi:MAG: hypothetical protein NZ853_11270 [Leptospiraceae bacterium]|nr:hypothetical protein [Leptospiraceae bacterium]MDW7975463.1 hypothetical protein [Leptospiraceae bacterium]
MKRKQFKFFFILFFLVLFVFSTFPSVFSKEEKDLNQKEKYDTKNSIQKDFQNQFSIALELRNSTEQTQRLLELFYLYPEEFQKPEIQKQILDRIYKNYSKNKKVEEFFTLLEELEKRNFLSKEIFLQYRKLYENQFF